MVEKVLGLFICVEFYNGRGSGIRTRGTRVGSPV